jgi:hypothetical protein
LKFKILSIPFNFEQRPVAQRIGRNGQEATSHLQACSLSAAAMAATARPADFAMAPTCVIPPKPLVQLAACNACCMVYLLDRRMGAGYPEEKPCAAGPPIQLFTDA